MISLRKLGLSALALALVNCGACLDSCQPKGVSYVDVPTTLEAVRARAKPPDVVVKIERITSGSGGSACAHSPVCIIVLPFVLLEMLFPQKYDLATIEEGGAPVYSGNFSTAGQFLRAEVREGDLTREIRRLDLAAIDRHPIVEVSRSLLDGGSATRTPIVPQLAPLDVLAEYRAKATKNHSMLPLQEAWVWLGPESMPLIREVYAPDGGTDEHRGSLLATVCASEPSPERTEVLSLSLATPGPHVAKEGAECLLRSDSQDAKPFLELLASGICESPTPGEYVSALTALQVQNRERIAGMLPDASCPTQFRRVLLREVLHAPVSPADLMVALISKDPLLRLLLQNLNNTDAVARGVLTDVIRAHAIGYQQAIDAFHDLGVTPTPHEAAVLAASYVEDENPHDATRRASTLELLASLESEEAPAEARAVLEAALVKASETAHPRIAVALAVLKAQQYQLPAARGLHSRFPSLPFGASSVDSDEELIEYGLYAHCRCSGTDLKNAAERAKRAKPSDRGVVCGHFADDGGTAANLAGPPAAHHHHHHH